MRLSLSFESVNRLKNTSPPPNFFLKKMVCYYEMFWVSVSISLIFLFPFLYMDCVEKRVNKFCVCVNFVWFARPIKLQR